MELIILGSGGCTATPRPACSCPICAQARRLGRPYARCGCSLYIPSERLLVDTPEDIVPALNAEDVPAVDRVLYSHWDPDHTMGMRVFEQLRLDWLDVDAGIGCDDPIDVYALPQVWEDMRGIRSPFGPFLDYYAHVRNLVCARECAAGEPFAIGDLRVTIVPSECRASVFVFESDGRRVVYAPCDVKPFPSFEGARDADCLIIGNTIVADVVKGGRRIPPGYPDRAGLFTMDEVCALGAELHAKEIVVTHIEEDWGRSYDEYCAMERGMPGVRFAYDGMRIRV